MAKAKATQTEIVLKTLARRAKGFTDAELIDATGIEHADTIRATLKRAGRVIAVGTKKNADTNRTLKTWGVPA